MAGSIDSETNSARPDTYNRNCDFFTDKNPLAGLPTQN